MIMQNTLRHKVHNSNFKIRLDKYLVAKRLVNSRDHAKELILNKKVKVNGKIVVKPAHLVNSSDKIKLLETFRYVSRAGYKLEFALKYFKVSVVDKIVLDIGSSTGGFVDCLLSFGAKYVYAVDKGVGLLQPKLKQNKKVILIEGKDAAKLKPKDLKVGLPDLITIDVSRDSVVRILGKIKTWMPKGTYVIVLIKPQFEVDALRGKLSNSSDRTTAAINKLKKALTDFNFKGVIQSPILGKHGQKEFLGYWEYLG